MSANEPVPQSPEHSDEGSDPEPTATVQGYPHPTPRASQSLALKGQDKALTAANQLLVRDLEGFQESSLAKADDLFNSIMDPNNEQTRMMMEGLFYKPMEAITQKAVDAITKINTEDPEEANRHILLVTGIFEASRGWGKACLDRVYDNMDRQIDHFSSSVDAYNLKMKETVSQALEMYEQRIDTLISARTKIMKQKRDECANWCEMSMQEAEVEAATRRLRSDADLDISERQLEVQKKKHELRHAKKMQDQERAEKKAQQELERQRKKDEQETERQRKKDEQEIKREESKIELLKKKDEASHQKVIKDLEAKAKKKIIDAEERARLMQELEIETARYNKEFGLAEHAMRTAISKGKGCKINHTAPKIEWSTPPRVVPGFVSWTSGC